MFERIFESVASGLVAVTPGGELIQANPAAARLLDFPRDQLARRKLADLVAVEAGSASVEELLARVIANQETLSDLTLTAAAGKHVLRATLAPLRDASGQSIGAVLTLSESPGPKPPTLPGTFYAKMLAHSPFGIAVFDGTEFRLRWANEAYRQFLEEPHRGNPFGAPVSDLVPQSEERGVIDIFRQVAATGIPFVASEFEHIGFARGVTYWRWALFPLAEGGEVPDLMLVATDVTEQVTMRQRVEAKRARLRTVLSTLPVGVMIIEPDGRIREANEMVHRIWGGTVPLSENFASWRGYRGWHPETGTLLLPEDWPASRALRGETVLGKVVDIERLDGSRGTILISAAPLNPDKGGRAGAVVVFHDITRQRLAERALRVSEQKFSRLFHLNPDWISLSRLEDGRILDVNGGFTRLTGYPQAEVIGKTSLADLHLWVDPQERTRFIQALREGKEVIHLEARLRSKEGRVFIGWISGRRLEIEGETLLLAIVRDITDQKWLEDELRRAKETAEAASKAKSEFLATVSHELRTPLTVIMGMTDLALDRLPDPEVRTLLETAQLSSDSLLLLINDILDVAEMESGKLHLADSSFSLRECLGEVVERFAAPAAKKGLRLSWKVAAEVPDTLVSDRPRVRQVLINLIGNAVKFTAHGSVTVRVGLHSGVATEILFHIRDTGVGVPREKRDRLFKPFSQANGSSTRPFGGTGLGLAISKGLIESLGGRIWMEEECGEGSTFCFTLPLRPPAKTD